MISTPLLAVSVLLAGVPPNPQFGNWGNWYTGQSAVEYSSMMSYFGIDPQTNKLVFGVDGNQLVSVYVPEEMTIGVVLRKENVQTPKLQIVFETVKGRGAPPFRATKPKGQANRTFEFTEEGHFYFEFFFNNQKTTEFHFDVEEVNVPGRPKPSFAMTGPWQKWGYLWIQWSVNQVAAREIKFRTWRKKGEKLQAKLFSGKTLIATSDQQSATGDHYKRLDFSFKKVKTQLTLTTNDFSPRTATYRIELERSDGTIESKYEFKTQSPKRQGQFVFPQPANLSDLTTIQIHPRQDVTLATMSSAALDENFIVPRMVENDLSKINGGDTAWLEKQSSGGNGAGGSRDRWVYIPRSQADRELDVKITSIGTTARATIAAGDGIVAYGTGDTNGVAYFDAKNPQSTIIANGNQYSSRLLFVTGRKLVLVKDRKVVVHDTDTGDSTEIPDVLLDHAQGGPYGPKHIAVDGNLVATVNETKDPTKNSVIKVIDLSQSPPLVIPVQDAKYSGNDVTDIAVDARTGRVAVSSQLKNHLYLTDLQLPPLQSIQREIDLSSLQSEISGRKIRLHGDSLVYVDTNNQLQILGIGGITPRRTTNTYPAVGAAGFALESGRIAISTTERFGSRHPFLVGNFPEKLISAGNLRDPIGEHHGYGMGGCVTIADDETVLIAGTGELNDSTIGKTLQAFQGDHWHVFRDDQTQPIPAIDVTAGHGIFAFKSFTQDQGYVVGLGVYGQRIRLPGQQALIVKNGNPQPLPGGNVPVAQGEQGQIVRKSPDNRTPEETPKTANATSEPGWRSRIGWIAAMFGLVTGIGVFFSRKILQSTPIA